VGDYRQFFFAFMADPSAVLDKQKAGKGYYYTVLALLLLSLG
jgi:hypothetical protein